MSKRTRLWLVALVVGGLFVALPGAAVAETDTATSDTAVVDEHSDFDKIKRRALNAIEKKLSVVTRLAHKVESSKTVTDEHAAKLLRDLRHTHEGLEELARKIKAAETPEELRELISMIGSYKVHQVLKPKVLQVLASDRNVAATRHLAEFSNTLEMLIERAAEAGYDVERPKYLLAKMRRNVAAAYELAAPVADAVIDLQPEDWPDPAKETLQKGARHLRAAADHVHVARKKARQIAHWLRNLADPPIDLAELG
ncbi:MAG: hypothetical protein HKN91_15985 [Acidimicrobiia bacterium]|nr:hypothetical protein [Acidimicrobiia bacterium]